MHNLILTSIKFWDPNSRMGDVKLLALASWMTHEEARAKEVKRVLEREDLALALSEFTAVIILAHSCD